ncbi:MAG: hypothetical protein N0E48_09190, partial [Candidatus Thiodiazotropha endolucinida]|nr:hypothetical protein [Candidatus Thiodiazotropha endolucinida]
MYSRRPLNLVIPVVRDVLLTLSSDAYYHVALISIPFRIYFHMVGKVHYLKQGTRIVLKVSAKDLGVSLVHGVVTQFVY